MALNDRSFVPWLREKRHELAHLRLRDVLLAKAVADIHRHTVRKKIEQVPLCACSPIHAIDRPAALATVRHRAQFIREYMAQNTHSLSYIDPATMAKILPSISQFHGVRMGPRVITFEGNGRVAALKQVFGVQARIKIPVVIHHCDEPKKIHRRVNRVRRLHQLSD